MGNGVKDNGIVLPSEYFARLVAFRGCSEEYLAGPAARTQSVAPCKLTAQLENYRS